MGKIIPMKLSGGLLCKQKAIHYWERAWPLNDHLSHDSSWFVIIQFYHKYFTTFWLGGYLCCIISRVSVQSNFGIDKVVLQRDWLKIISNGSKFKWCKAWTLLALICWYGSICKQFFPLQDFLLHFFSPLMPERPVSSSLCCLGILIWAICKWQHSGLWQVLIADRRSSWGMCQTSLWPWSKATC